MCLGLLLLTVCGEPGGPTGPDGETANLRASFSFAPTFPTNAAQTLHAAALDVDNVHIVLKRQDGTVALDTIVVFPAGVDEVTLQATVTLRAATEQFSAAIQLRSGATVLFEGTQTVDAKAGVATTQPIPVTTHYTGPGATATKVTINPRTVPLGSGATAQLTAIVTDAAGAAIAGVPATWTSSDPSVATVSATGLVTSLNKRGTSSISIKILSGLTDAVPATVTLPPSAIRVVSGSGQSGRAGDALAQPLVVEVDAADGVGVAGVTVNFRGLATAASVSPASVVTDANGRASTTMTLGSQASTQTFEATAGSLNVSTTATATAAAASQLAIVTGNAQSDTTGKTLAQPFVVLASDRFGNAVSGVTVTWQRVTGNGATAAATSTTGANGQASMTYTLGAQPGPETVSATITGAPAVTFTATAVARPPAAIVATTATTFTGTVGSAVGALGVKVTNSLGAPVAGVSVTWSVAGTATIGTPSATTATDGTAVNTFTFGNTAGVSTISASFSGGPQLQFKLTAIAGPAAQLLIVSGNNQSANAGADVVIAPSVRLVDSYNNPVSGSITFAATGGGGSVTGSPATTDATGLATVGSWKLGPAGPQTLTASLGTITAVFNATSVSVGPPQLAITQQPSATIANGTSFATQPQVQLKDNGGTPLALANVPVTVALASGGQVLNGTLTVNTNASGVAIFSGLSILGTVGTNSLQFTSNGYTAASSTTFTVGAGQATQIAAVSSQSLSGNVGGAASPVPQVVLKDVSGNAVSGETLIFSVPNAASGVVVGGSAVTNANGAASPTSWTFDTTPGKDTLYAAFGSVSGSPVIFEATVVSGAATQLVIISGNNQTGVTGQPLAAPLVVEARDALNNPVANFGVAFQTTGGGGTPSTATASTAANGQTSFTWTMGPAGAQNSRVCLLPNCTGTVFFSALAVPVGTDATWTGASSTAWNNTGNWSPAVVPTPTSNVFIPAGRPNSPVLPGLTTVADLTMASGTTLNTGGATINVGGNLLASSATIAGGGNVNLNGAGKQVAGAFPSVTVGGNTTLTGPTTITGTLTLTNGAALDVSAATMTVSSDLTVVSGARLKMNNASGRLVVGGNAFFNATDMGDGDLTAGVLELKGNLTAGSNNYQAFRAVGTHLTKFSGTASQTISIYYSADNQSRFQNLEMANAAGVVFASTVVAGGAVTIAAPTNVTGNQRLYAGGPLTSPAGSSIAQLADVVIYSGGSFPSIAGNAPPMTYLSTGGTIAAPGGSTTLLGSLTVTGGSSLDIGANTLTITGSLTTATGSGARIKMNNPAGRLIVNGDVGFNATDMGDGDLTAGMLELKGNFSAGSNNYQAFRATGSHLTKFSGTAPQTIAFYYAADNQSRFQNLELANASGVALSSTVVVRGDALVGSTTTLSGNQRLYVGGQLNSPGGSSLAQLADVVIYAGSSFPIITGNAPPMTYLSTATTIAAPSGSTTLQGSLTLTGGSSLDIGANTLNIAGSLTTATGSGARVKMNDPAGRLIVNGDVSFNATDMGDGDLTAGVMELKGNFSAGSNNYQAFRATGSHLTKFSGSAPQTISFYYAADNQSRFQNLELANASGIVFSNTVVVRGDALIGSTTTLSGNKRLYVGGQLNSPGGSSLAQLADVVIYAGSSFPIITGNAPPMTYLSTANVIAVPSGSTTLQGSLTLNGGSSLDIGANSLTVTGSLTTSTGSGARIKMNNAAGRLVVNGDVSFNATDMGDGDLTAGVLELKGNFSAGSNNYQAFRAAGTHLTKFSGSAPQTISFYYPSDNQSRFQGVELANANGIVFTNTVVVRGDALVSSTTTLSGNQRLYVGGQLNSPGGSSLAQLADVVIYAGNSFPIITGNAPPMTYFSTGTVIPAPSGSTTLQGGLTLTGGSTLDIGANALTVTGSFATATGSGSRLKMNDGAGVFIVQGDASFNATDMGDGDLTAGTLELKGNFAAGSNNYQAFRAAGSHVTKFSGNSAQTISFYYPGSTQSRFQDVVFSNASGAGVSIANSAIAAGNSSQLGRLTVPASTSLYILGSLALGGSSTTTVQGTLSAGSCGAAAGASYSGFTCSLGGSEPRALIAPVKKPDR